MRELLFGTVTALLITAAGCKSDKKIEQQPVPSQNPAAPAETTTRPADDTTTARPDNTGRNDELGKPTADQADQNQANVDMTARIREAIVHDDALSVSAQNVKVIVENGKVTLRGPVKTQAERDAIEAKASAVVGANNVINQLEIVP